MRAPQAQVRGSASKIFLIKRTQVPRASLEKLLRLPYCLQAYEPNGLSPDQFNSHPATIYTVNEFTKASAGLEEYVGQRLAVAAAHA